MYAAPHNAEDGESYGSIESLNNVTNVAFSQHPQTMAMRQQQGGPSQEYVLVQETPTPQEEPGADQATQESYQQTQFPEEYQQGQITEEDQAVVLVRETPPGTGTHGVAQSRMAVPGTEGGQGATWPRTTD